MLKNLSTLSTSAPAPRCWVGRKVSRRAAKLRPKRTAAAHQQRKGSLSANAAGARGTAYFWDRLERTAICGFAKQCTSLTVENLLGLFRHRSSGEALAAEERPQIVKASIALCNSGAYKPFVRPDRTQAV